MSSLIAKVRVEIEKVLGGKDRSWVVREVNVCVPVLNDITKVNFLAELEDLLRKYGKLEDTKVRAVAETYIDGRWMTEQEIKDFQAQYQLDLMKDMGIL